MPSDSTEKKGISQYGMNLNEKEWDNFKAAIPMLMEVLPGLYEVQACLCLFEGNQLGFITCRRCNYFDFKNWV